MSSGHGTVHAKTAACEGAKGVGRSSGASRPASGLADRPQLTVMVSYDMLAREIGRGTLDTGQMLTPETVRRMACDARVLPAVMGGAGQVLDLGRAQRTWTGPARRAVILRDQGCVFPSCDRTASWCDVHHIKHWSRGGPTDLTNGALLCGFHHQLVHHSGWQIRMAPDGRPEIVPPMWIDPLQRPLRNRYHRRP